MTGEGRAGMTCGWSFQVRRQPECGPVRSCTVSNAHSELAQGFVQGGLLVRGFPPLAYYEGALQLVGAGGELSGAGACHDYGAGGDAAPVDDFFRAGDVDDGGGCREHHVRPEDGPFFDAYP